MNYHAKEKQKRDERNMPEKFRKLQRISNHKKEEEEYVPRYTIDKVSCVGLIGKGAYGKVFEVLMNGDKAALKVQNGTRASKPHRIVMERDCLIYLKHKRVINLQGAFCINENAYLVFDLCVGEFSL